MRAVEVLPKQVPCPEVATIDGALAERIKAIPSGHTDWAEMAEGETFDCALVARHRAGHLAHVQTTPEPEFAEWWLRWGDGVIVLVAEPVCEAELGIPEADGHEPLCVLPDQHDLPHTDGGSTHWLGPNESEDD